MIPTPVMAPPVYIALVHYPVTDKHGLTVTTSVTNLDVHDISRSARTYGVKRFFVITPVESQHWIVRKVLDHWEAGWGATYNPNRKDALGLVQLSTDLGAASDAIQDVEGKAPIWVTTSAKPYPNSISYRELRRRMGEDELDRPVCLLFGTGWGLHPEIMIESELVLEPIFGPSDYNHLSVRSAVAIILDRLLAPIAE